VSTFSAQAQSRILYCFDICWTHAAVEYRHEVHTLAQTAHHYDLLATVLCNPADLDMPGQCDIQSRHGVAFMKQQAVRRFLNKHGDGAQRVDQFARHVGE